MTTKTFHHYQLQLAPRLIT